MSNCASPFWPCVTSTQTSRPACTENGFIALHLLQVRGSEFHQLDASLNQSTLPDALRSSTMCRCTDSGPKDFKLRMMTTRGKVNEAFVMAVTTNCVIILRCHCSVPSLMVACILILRLASLHDSHNKVVNHLVVGSFVPQHSSLPTDRNLCATRTVRLGLGQSTQ